VTVVTPLELMEMYMEVVNAHAEESALVVERMVTQRAVMER
jgi:hypothetical protein